MFYKLSFRNVKRSLRDYSVYFLTLTFSVCLFYMFNSIKSQSAMLQLSEMQMDLIEGLSQVIGVVSVFVAFIIGFLIIYANKFLIRKRKKEIGLYMSLGMGKRKISSLLVFETVIIGIFSLTTGLILGVFLSQGLAALTSKLFSVDLTEYKFIFSSETLIKTIIYFGVMFLIVMIFNAFIVSKYKLIDLLHGDKKNESLKIKGKFQIIISVFIFIASIASLGVAYYLIFNLSLPVDSSKLYTSIGLGVLGTFLFFLSLSGFLLKVLQSNKKIYLKNLNMFLLRQINSKVNTTFISMTIICLMLFFTIVILSTGLSINSSISKKLDIIAPFDASVSAEYFEEPKEFLPVNDIAKSYNLDPKKYAKEYVEFYEYHLKIDVTSIFKSSSDKNIRKDRFLTTDALASAIKLSDYNAIQKLKGESEITLKDNEALVLSNYLHAHKAINEYLAKNKFKVEGKTYSHINEKLLEENIQNSNGGRTVLTLVLPDKDVKDFKKYKSVINIRFKDIEKDEQDFSKKFSLAGEETTNQLRQDNNKVPYFDGGTKEAISTSLNGITVIALYIGLYIGIVFLIASAAILAIQQLSEATDNIKRYEILRKIGVPNKMANKSMLIQTFIYFMMPLSLALVHSVFGVYFFSNMLSASTDYDILLPSIITTLIICIIYGGYFIATYFGYKNVVKRK